MAAGTSPASAVGKAPMRSRARLTVSGLGELLACELETLGDGVGVREQDLPLAGESQAARLALEQARPDLALQAPTWLETEGWESESARAARENERWCATARNVNTRRGSIAYRL